MGNDYLDSLSGKPMAWFKRKSVRLAVLCLAILAVVLIVLFSKQIGDLLELWGLKAAPAGRTITLTADGTPPTGEKFFFEGTEYNVDPVDSFKIENNQLMLNPLPPPQP